MILDTNVIIRLMKGDHDVLRLLESWEESVSTTVVNVYEVLKGREDLVSLLEKFVIYHLTEMEVKIASDLYKRLKSSGRAKGDVDILIASIAISHNETLVTFDRDFQDMMEFGLKAVILG
jgi:predicted nucleic acid-binding protein